MTNDRLLVFMFAVFLAACACVNSPWGHLENKVWENQEFDTSADYRRVALRIKNCKFLACMDTNISHDGGAIDVHESEVSIRNSLFDLCVSVIAGAVSFTSCRVELIMTNFTDNRANEEAGAGLFYNSTVQMSGGASIGNAACGSGAFSFVNTTGSIIYHAFVANEAHEKGTGGLYIEGKPVSISRCTFVHNHVDGGYSGAIVVALVEGIVTIRASRFISNEVLGEAETHIFVVTGKSTTVRLELCMFDTPLNDVLEAYANSDGKMPTIERTQLKFDLQLNNPWINEAKDVEKGMWKEKLQHSQSDLFTALMFVAVPVFIGAAVFILNIAV